MTTRVTRNRVFSPQLVGVLFVRCFLPGTRTETAQGQPFEPVKPTAGTIVMSCGSTRWGCWRETRL